MNKKISTKEICLLPLLGVIMFVLKVVMADLPNIEPVTLLIIIYTLNYKRKAAWSILIYVILEMLVYGVSIYSAAYFYIWCFLMAMVLLFRKHKSALFWAIFSAAFGFLFGALYIPIYLVTSGLETAIAWWLAGISFDLLHAAGNFILTLLLFVPLDRLFEKLKMS